MSRCSLMSPITRAQTSVRQVDSVSSALPKSVGTASGCGCLRRWTNGAGYGSGLAGVSRQGLVVCGGGANGVKFEAAAELAAYPHTRRVRQASRGRTLIEWTTAVLGAQIARSSRVCGLNCVELSNRYGVRANGATPVVGSVDDAIR